MNSVSTAIVCYTNTALVREFAPVVLRAVATEAAKRQLESVAGAFLAGPMVCFLGMSLPYVVDRVKSVAGMTIIDVCKTEELCWTKIATELYLSRGDLLQIIIALARNSPAQMIYEHGGNLIKAVVLDEACKKVTKKLGKYTGGVTYAVVSVKLMPTASPFTLPVAQGILYLTNLIGTKFLYSSIKPVKTLEIDVAKTLTTDVVKACIELDDFKKKEKVKALAIASIDSEDEYVIVSQSLS